MQSKQYLYVRFNRAVMEGQMSHMSISVWTISQASAREMLQALRWSYHKTARCITWVVKDAFLTCQIIKDLLQRLCTASFPTATVRTGHHSTPAPQWACVKISVWSGLFQYSTVYHWACTVVSGTLTLRRAFLGTLHGHIATSRPKETHPGYVQGRVPHPDLRTHVQDMSKVECHIQT